MNIPTKMPRIVGIVALVMAGVTIISALLGQIATLPFALIPLIAGIGILRRRAWNAYGFALYLFSQLFLVSLALFRGETVSLGLIAATVLTMFLGCTFFLAGRSLASTGAAQGRPVPWIATSAVCTLPLLFLQPFVIPTGAMEDTLLTGDRVLVQRFPRPRVMRGDLIVFFYPADQRQVYVKRIIGVPGDRIRISHKVVYRNGAAIKEPYAVHKTEYEDPYRDNFPSEPDSQLAARGREMLTEHVVNGEVVVPEGSYFVLGDNRDHSFDSRYWGFVASNNLIGKPLLIYDSKDQSTEEVVDRKAVWRYHTRWERLLKLL